jgi:hypothetical protein
MVSTSFTVAALLALSAGSVPSVNWQADYPTAMSAAVAQQKPMAVFIGQGEAGYAKLVAGGQIPVSAGQVLSSEYVSVYVNTDTAAGKALAGQFEMSAGLVISTRGGAKQALRLPGTVNATDLTGVLTTLGTTTVVSTPAATVVPASYAAPATYAAPVMNYAPVQMYAPAYAPAYAPRTISFGGGCANGRCGLR